MKLILFTGNEKINPIWNENIYESTNSDFDKIVVYKSFDCVKMDCPYDLFLKELERIKQFAKTIENEKYAVFAKTTSIPLVIKAINLNILKPERCVFVGIPIVWARINNIDIDSDFMGFNTKTIYVQRIENCDFYYDNLSEYLKSKRVENYNVVEFDLLNADDKILKELKDIAIRFLKNDEKPQKLFLELDKHYFKNKNKRCSN